MESTRPSLLMRVKHRDDESAWREFCGLYSPLLKRFARMQRLSEEEAEDVAQECMNSLCNVMESFNYSRDRGSFKNYLYTLAVNRIASRKRRRRPRLAESGELQRIAVYDEDPAEAWEQQWLRQHLAFCLKEIESDFAPETIVAFKLYVLKERPVGEVCSTLNMTANQVYLAKSRVTRRLRTVLNELIGDEF